MLKALAPYTICFYIIKYSLNFIIYYIWRTENNIVSILLFCKSSKNKNVYNITSNDISFI